MVVRIGYFSHPSLHSENLASACRVQIDLINTDNRAKFCFTSIFVSVCRIYKQYLDLQISILDMFLCITKLLTYVYCKYQCILKKNTTYPQTFIKSHKGLSYCRLLSNLSVQTVIISHTKSTSFISCFRLCQGIYFINTFCLRKNQMMGPYYGFS